MTLLCEPVFGSDLDYYKSCQIVTPNAQTMQNTQSAQSQNQ